MRRVLCAVMAHETNTFSKDLTTLDTVKRREFYLGNQIAEVRRGTRSNFGGSFEAADKFGWQLVHPIIASANPSGTVTDEAFEYICGQILDAVDQAGGVDAALLHLHGAMVVDSHPDAEGELLRRLRAKVGPKVPIAVTLDLHGNITPLMAENANALIAFKTYPHIDQYERAWQGAEILERAMNGEIEPRVVLARRRMLTGLDMGRTQGGPMKELVDAGTALEEKGEQLSVSVFAGFPHADIADVGPSVAIAYDAKTPGAEAAARATAERFMDRCWETRDYAALTFLSPEQAAKKAKAEEQGAKAPLVIADYTDNPGGGGYGDTTALLKAMVDADLQNAAFHAICDPEAIAEGMKAGVGSTITLENADKWAVWQDSGVVEVTVFPAFSLDPMAGWGEVPDGFFGPNVPGGTFALGAPYNSQNPVILTYKAGQTTYDYEIELEPGTYSALALGFRHNLVNDPSLKTATLGVNWNTPETVSHGVVIKVDVGGGNIVKVFDYPAPSTFEIKEGEQKEINFKADFAFVDQWYQ